MAETTTSWESFDSRTPTRAKSSKFDLKTTEWDMERQDTKARIRSRDWVRRRHAAGWRTVSALMPPELVEKLDRLAADRPRAHVLMELIEQAADTQNSGGGA